MSFISYAQNAEDVMLWRALRDIKAGWYIDVGAHDPEIHSVTRAFYDRGWSGLNLEPVKHGHERLAHHRPRDINLCVAVGDNKMVVPFYVNSSSGLSTLSRDVADEHAAAGLPSHERLVAVQTLAELCHSYAPPEIHFLKVDVEGAEAAVLRGADFSAYRPWIVLVEATRPNSPEPNHMAWEPILVDAEYRFVWFDGLNRFYVASEHYPVLARHFCVQPNVFDDFTTVQVPVPTPVPVPMPQLHFPSELERRIAMAAQCHDADTIPKTPDAGMIQTRADGTRVQVMHNGILVEADGYYGPWMTSLIARCRGHHEPQEERLFHEVTKRLPERATMLELGGYWAFYSLWFMSGSPSRRAIVVEPDPAHRSVGEANARLNALCPEFIAGFVGAHPTPPVAFQTEQSGEILLPCLSVPQILQSRGIDTLDVLHCDVQGAELAVLESCVPLFEQRRIGWLFVSTHARQISGSALTHQRCLALLRAQGAFIEVEHDVHESFSGDGLIVARFGPALPNWVPVELTRNRYAESLFRNPLYDLDEALAETPDTLRADWLVAAARRALLLNAASPALLQRESELLRSQGLQPVLAQLLHGDEFASTETAFNKRYFDKPHEVRATSLPRLVVSGSWLSLPADGALGPGGDTLLSPNDKTMLPAIVADGAWQADEIDFVARHLDGEHSYLLLDIGANIGTVLPADTAPLPQCNAHHGSRAGPGQFRGAWLQSSGLWKSRQVIHTALGDVAGTAPFYRDDENFGNYSLNPDAMRDRPFKAAEVEVTPAREWFSNVPAEPKRLIWKTDTQGCDELIVAEAPWAIWSRVTCAVIELWRIAKPSFDMDAFRAKLDSMPNRSIGPNTPASTDEIIEFLSGRDWHHDDLYLWR